MSKKCLWYTQCKLSRGEAQDVAFIPSKFAKKGQYLEIKGVNGWKIESVGGKLPADVVLANAREYEHHREETDE